MNDDNQKISWKKGSQRTNTKDIKQSSSSHGDEKNDVVLGDETISDLARRSADHRQKFGGEKTEKTDETISDLQADIQKLLDGLDEDAEKGKEKKEESSKNSPALSAALGAIESKKDFSQKEKIGDNKDGIEEAKTVEDSKSKEEKIHSLKESIFEDLGVQKKAPSKEVLDDQTQKLLDQKEQVKGIDKTYYSDLSTAMGANKPATMAELIEKARYEKKEKAILSPKSKKNLFYIIGALLLIGGIVGLVSLLSHKKDKPVTYITKERVKSLVYSDSDVGIDTTDIGPEKLKQAIRKVLKKEIDEDSVEQIYYVKKDEFGNLRRIGVKQVFEATGNTPPKLLYENIEKDFMHGFYRKNNKNYPFIILKTLSYDRAFEGMKEWEPTMIDDLSTYLDLSKEAGDRSLIEDGFSDDIIQNKTARVVRFLPRDVDRRKGFLDTVSDFLSGRDKNTNEEVTENSLVGGDKEAGNNTNKEDDTTVVDKDTESNSPLGDVVAYLLKRVHHYFSPFAYAAGTSSVKKCFKVKYQCMDLSGNTANCSQAVLDCRYKKQGCDIPGVKDYIIMPEILNKETDMVYNYTQARDDDYHFSCIEIKDTKTLKNDKLIDNIDYQKYSGDQLVCYRKTRECVNENGEIVDYDPNDPKQICHDIIHNKNFDKRYDADYVKAFSDDYIKEHFSCIVAIDGSHTIQQSTQGIDNLICYESFRECFDTDGKPVRYDPNDDSITCNTIIKNTKSDPTYGPEYQGQVDAEGNPYICVQAGKDSHAIGDDMGFNYNLMDSVVCYPSHWECTDEYGNDMPYDPNDSRLICNKIINNMAIPVYGGVPESQMDNYICSGFHDGKNLMYSRNPFAWIADLFPDGLILPGGPIRPGDTLNTSVSINGTSTTLNVVQLIQNVFVQLGAMNTLSANGNYNTTTQDIISGFQAVNGLNPTGILDQATLNVINNIISGYNSIYGGSQAALVNNYIGSRGQIGIGSYSEDVQTIQILLYSNGYYVNRIDGVFDRELCDAVRAYEKDNGFTQSDENTCILSSRIIDSFNKLIKDKNYLGSGYIMNGNGYLVGSGILKGKRGPGVVGFEINKAEADSLKEGDIVLIYTFLDEKTILITRNEVVIPEIIKRRAFNDIFNKKEKAVTQ